MNLKKKKFFQDLLVNEENIQNVASGMHKAIKISRRAIKYIGNTFLCVCCHIFMLSFDISFHFVGKNTLREKSSNFKNVSKYQYLIEGKLKIGAT